MLSPRIARWRNGATVRECGLVTAPVPAVVLMDPKYAHNVGQVVRLACCFGARTVIYTGDRVDLMGLDARIPREERMRDYAEVNLIQYDAPFLAFADAVPVAVEVRENAEQLPTFVHPANAVYVFGPEDGGLGRVSLQHCHRFVSIPARHCLNLATAVACVLYDRMTKYSPEATPS